MRSDILITFLQHTNSNVLLKLSRQVKRVTLKNALKTNAYRSFLSERNINLRNIKFSNLPTISKETYITPNKLTDLLSHSITDHYTIEMSSGFSGNPLYWPRYKGQDDNFLDYMQMGLVFTFSIDRIPTLFINTFALGTWVTGVKLAKFALELSNKKNNKLLTMNTGVVLDDVLKILKDISPYFKQTIIAGYPPFLTTIIDRIEKENNTLKSSIRLLAGGEAFSENWRKKINQQLGNSKDDIYKIISAYGSADTGLEIGYEQPVTVLLRKLLVENPQLKRKYLGEKYNFIPHFFQFNPLNVFIEEEHQELIFTSNSAVPLVRYNLHDAGGILSFEKMVEILKTSYSENFILRTLKPLRLPCCYVFGRSDGTISLDGMNIYLEEIKQTFDDTKNIQFFAKQDFKSIEEILRYIPNKQVAKIIQSNNKAIYTYFKYIEFYTFSVIENKLSFIIYIRSDIEQSKIKKIKSLLNKVLPYVLYHNCKGYNTIVNEQLDSSILNIEIVSKPYIKSIKNKYLLKHD